MLELISCVHMLVARFICEFELILVYTASANESLIVFIYVFCLKYILQLHIYLCMHVAFNFEFAIERYNSSYYIYNWSMATRARLCTCTCAVYLIDNSASCAHACRYR